MKRGLKSRIRNGDQLYGIFVMVPSPAVVEMAGYAGLDYVVLDTEHGAAGGETLENMLRAADAAGIAALVRVSSPAPGEILRALDAGACGILVPHVVTPENAAAVASAAHYPPLGLRGIATTTRAGRHGLTTIAEHLVLAREETVVLTQIEDAAALPNVKAIASTPGIDGIFIGPADLSISMGQPGNPSHPDVAAAIAGAARDAKAAGAALAMFARSESDARELAVQGFTVVCLSTTSIFSRRLAELVENLHK
jgi:4-hydroxy-2-oxoheptanedioate aldolase